MEGPGTEIPSRSQTVDVRDDSSETEEKDTGNSPREHTDDSEWVPESSYLQGKLQSDNTADGVAYQLRSSLV